MRMTTRLGRRVAGTALALLTGGAIAVTPASPAAAGNFNGSCEGGEVCLWYLPGYLGPIADFYDSVSNYGFWHFYNSSYWLANNTMSAKNEAAWACVEFFDNANYSGSIAFLHHWEETGNFDEANNRIQSHKFGFTPPWQC